MRTIRQAGEALRARKVSCEELVREAIRAEEAQRDLNCFITLTAEQALQEARQLDKELAAGHDRGPLHGIPIAHKDLFYTAGVRTTNGTKVFADFVPDHDAVVVEKLRSAGTVSLGKLNQHENAYGITSTNPHYGPVRNPHDRDRIPGGSSGGSGAAVAAGILFGATGSDTGGSIRIPASFCGVVGFKATYGRVSSKGCFPLGSTLDHMGPFARSVEDVVLLLNAMASEPVTAKPNAAVRVGLPQNYFFDGAQPEVREGVEAAVRRAESLGAQVVPVRVPEPEELTATARAILLFEAATAMLSHLHRRDQFGTDVATLLETGAAMPASDYVAAMAEANRLRMVWAKLFENIDVLALPSTPTVAPLIGQQKIVVDGEEHDTRLLTTRTCRGINLLGYPTISIPCGRTKEGLPIGLQIVGGANRDDVVLGVAAALERA
jgi:aspartyl-tRNA(Asn)/glutamyl-tRNA(Gln) amidotransferase subunit A